MISDKFFHKNKHHTIPPVIANLLHEIEEGWYSPPISLSHSVSLVWGDVNLSIYVKTISLKNNELVVMCELPNPGENTGHQDYPLENLINQELQILCKDGTTITSRQAYVHSYGFDSYIDNSGTRIQINRVRIAASEWKLLRHNAKPVLWVGEIDGNQLDGFGNLILTAKSGNGAFSSGHFCLQGDKYIYYVLQVQGGSARKSLMVINANSTDIDLGNIYISIKNLAFCFGQTLQVKSLHGLSTDGQIVGNIGGNFGAKYSTSNMSNPPIPIMYHDITWIAPFFRKLSLCWRDLGGVFDLALYYYIDSLSETLTDGAYSKIMLGLIALSELYIEKTKPDLQKGLFSNRKKWGKIYARVAREISSIAKPGMSDVIDIQLQMLGKIDSSNAIEICLGLAKIPISDSVREALAIGRIALTGKLDDNRGDIYSQLACLRAILVAIISRFIHYKGDISGWLKEEPYFYFRPAPQDWWNNDEDLEDEKEARSTYAGHYTTTIDRKVQWPSFHKLTVPSEGIISSLTVFANGLANKTGNVVVAIIQPLPIQESSNRTFDFTVMLREHPSVRSVLFTIELTPDGILTIYGWQDDILSIKTTKELNSFLSEVAGSSDVQQRIQRLLQTSDDISQGQ